MRTITRTITLYTADELKAQSPKAFDKARENYGETTHHGWWESTYDDFQTVASLMGFISFTGFWSQGDGASFTGSAAFAADALEKVKDYAPQDEELHRIAAECAAYGTAGIHAKLERISRQYSHENTVTVDAWFINGQGEEEGLPNEKVLPDTRTLDVQQTCRALMRWLYRQLEKEYEYQSGEECFLETAEANGWTFTEAGKLEHGEESPGVKAVRELHAEMWDDLGSHFTCLETEAICQLFRECGLTEHADAFMEAHTDQDEEGDAHYSTNAGCDTCGTNDRAFGFKCCQACQKEVDA